MEPLSRENKEESGHLFEAELFTDFLGREELDFEICKNHFAPRA